MNSKIGKMDNSGDSQQLKQRLFSLLKEHSYREGEVVLSSGKRADYYIDARVVTLSSEGAYLTALIILDFVEKRAEFKNICAVGGPTLGADPFLGAISALSFLDKKPLNTFIVRKAAKQHGAGRRIEGPLLKKGDHVVVVDDVATSGKSLVDCILALRREGVEVCGAIVVIDREEGANTNLAKVDCPFISIFKASDFKSK